MFNLKTPLSFILIGFTALSVSAQKSSYKIKKIYHVQSSGSWDYISVNKNRIYLSHGTQVNILDKNTGDSVGIISNTPGVHGIAFDNSLNRGYTSNGRGNNVTVFDLQTNKVITEISVGQNPDAIFYEPYSKTIVTCNGRSKDLTFINTANNTVVATVPVGGKPEAAVSDEQGKLFVNIEDKNEIVAVDVKAFKALAHWSLAPGEGPSGLVIDTKTKRLFSTCDKLLVVVDATNGKVLDKLPIGDGTDGAAFDNATKTIYTANGEGNITVVKEESANSFKVVETIPTKKSARTIAIDEQTHTLYLPTADFEKTVTSTEPTAKGRPARPKMIPGTFQVLVVGKE